MQPEKLQVQLTKKQQELLKSFNDRNITEILYGGGARGGKSWGVCEIINMTCLNIPGIVRLVGREEWDDLRKTTLTTLIKVLNHHGIISGEDYTLNLQTKELKYYNGSKVLFVPLKQQPSDPEFNWLGSYEITYGFVDEAQQVSRKAIDIILSRCTEKIKEYDLVGKVIMTCNPMKCHLYNDFIKPWMNGELPFDRIFIPSLYKDNPFIDHKKYEESLKRADKVTKERLLKGNREYDDDPTKLYQYDDINDLFTNSGESGEHYITSDIARLGNDKTVTKEAQIEIDKDERPEIVNSLKSIDDYEVIYVGGPIYWGQLPQPMVTQLEKLNWNGKIVRPFTTHEGSGLAGVPSQLKNICEGAEVLEGLAIRGSSVYQAKETVENWL